MYATHNQDYTINSLTNGTHLVGSIEIPYSELIKKLGQPMMGDGEKVQAEWVIQFDDGTIATIYDWKETISVHRVTDWHIGGFNSDAAEHVQDLFHDAVTKISA